MLEGKIPKFRIANGTDAHLFTGLPDAFDDGSYMYGFHMSPTSTFTTRVVSF